jgi:hypothetical protein
VAYSVSEPQEFFTIHAPSPYGRWPALKFSLG